MKKLLSIILTILISLSALLLASCGESYAVYETTCFNTYVYVAFKGKDFSGKVKSEMDSLLASLETELSATKVGSCIYNFNMANKNENITLTDNAKYLINEAKSLYADTLGGFNSAVYPLVKLWQLDSSSFNLHNQLTVPTPEQINALLPLSNMDKVVLSSGLENTYAYKTDDGVMIDLGGIAKGYAVDKLTEIIKREGYTEGYISIGGSSLRLFNLSDPLSVTHPRKDGHILSVNAENAAVSTSGDYERYYEIDGIRYCHIIDGATGAPIKTGIMSATVIGGTACFTDAVTTALCTFEIEDLKTYITQNLAEYKVFVFADVNGALTLFTNQSEGAYTLLDKDYTVVKL